MKKPLLTIVLFVLAAFSTTAFAQTRTVSGKVTGSDDGLPLPQVSIFLKGTTTGVPTNLEGEYRINVPTSGGILVFRYLGYVTQEIEIGNQTVINVIMAPEATSLGEVVVTGYGVESKRDLTGSIGQVKAEEIAGLPVQSFDKAIQGRIAGVQIQSASGQPGGFASFLIRGQSSLTSNTPLFIVDGVQVISGNIGGQASSNALANLNPDDIESIEVLKDAAAAAIYGAQSANGVVIITTKRGGADQTKVEIGYQIGVNQPINLYDMMDARQFAEIRAEAFANAGLNVGIALSAYGNANDPSTLNNYDWVDAMYHDGLLQTFTAKVSGGTEKTSFYVSAATEEQEGHIIKSTFNRRTVRTNINHKASEKLTMGLNLGITESRQFGTIAGGFVNSPLFAAFAAQPNSPAINPETGEFNPYPLSGRQHLVQYNILQGVNEEVREITSASILANLNLNYKILDNLSFNVLGGVNFINSQDVNNRPSSIPVFSGFGGQVTIGNDRRLNWNANATLNGNTSFGDGDHSVSGILGVEVVRSNFEDQNATVRGFANPAQRTLDDGAVFQDINGSETYNTRAGAFIRGNYDYKKKYYFNATFRRDGSSRFGARNRVGTFWSTGASWRIKDESFMQNVNFLDDLKLRVSYGELGNSNGINNFEALPSFSGSGQYLGAPGQVLNLANEQLTWERSKQLNFGFDYAILDSRISGSIDFFRNDTRDQLFNTPLPLESGFTTIRFNVGEVRNEGIELELQSVNIDRGDFKWVSNFNITFLRNEVLSLPDGLDSLGIGTNTDLIVGQSTDFLWGVNYAGVNPANGRPMWINRAGQYVYGNIDTQEDAYVIGKANPDGFGGLANTLTYKGFTLDIFFQFQFGLDAVNTDLSSYADSGSGENNQLVSQLDRWQNPGDVTNVPIAYEGGQVDGFDLTSLVTTPGEVINNGRYMSDASYLRLKQVTLAYDLPSSFVSKIGMDRVNLFAQAINLWTLTNYDGIDPEVAGRQASVGASNTGQFPVGRQLTMGINITF